MDEIKEQMIFFCGVGVRVGAAGGGWGRLWIYDHQLINLLLESLDKKDLEVDLDIGNWDTRCSLASCGPQQMAHHGGRGMNIHVMFP